MNLQQFIDHRPNCLACGEPLTPSLHPSSKRKQIVVHEDDRLVFIFNLASFNDRGKGFGTGSVGYSVGLQDNSLCLEFYNNAGERLTKYGVSLSLWKRFEELHQNLRDWRMTGSCVKCAKHNYRSFPFDFSLHSTNICDLVISDETLELTHPVDNYLRVYQIYNNNVSNSSHLRIWKQFNSDDPSTNQQATYLDLPLFPLVPAQEMIKRLNNLLIFT